MNEGHATTGSLWAAFYGGAAFGCLLWLCLSRGIPPNLLMAVSQLTNIILFIMVPSLPGDFFSSDFSVCTYLRLCGMQSSSRLLFIIWNFNEDFSGGFQVACKRIGILEALRSGVGWLAVRFSYLGLDWINKHIVLIVSSSSVALLLNAPRCYVSCVLPQTGLLQGLTHKSFLLLAASELLNALCSYHSEMFTAWLKLNGWSTKEIGNFALVISLVSPAVLLVIFALCLSKMNSYGPWAMRDFTCLLPPGSLVRVLALYDLGFLHHRSMLFVCSLAISVGVDVARSAAIWSSMMIILGNRWYALKGCFLVLSVASMCSALSPTVGEALATSATGTSILTNTVTLDRPIHGKGSFGDAMGWAVIPLSAASYMLQIATIRYFNRDVLTFKGHGNLLPDGAVTGGSTSYMICIPVSHVRKLKAADARWSGVGHGHSEELDEVAPAISIKVRKPMKPEDGQREVGSSTQQGPAGQVRSGHGSPGWQT